MALKAEKSDIQNTTQGQFTSYQKNVLLGLWHNIICLLE